LTPPPIASVLPTPSPIYSLPSASASVPAREHKRPQPIYSQPTSSASVPAKERKRPHAPGGPLSNLLPGQAATRLHAEAHPFYPPEAAISELRVDAPSYCPSQKRVRASDSPPTGQLKPSEAKPPDMSDELGKFISLHTNLLRELGWSAFVRKIRDSSDLTTLENVKHPAKRLLKHYKYRGAPVKFSTPPWSSERVSQALARGAHKSCLAHQEFLHEEFADMIAKSQWVILPASAVKDIPDLRISPPGVIPQRDRRPRWICDYSFSGVNEETLPLAALDSMQFGHALDRILREILLADPSFGPVKMMKIDLSDGFYRMDVNIEDIPKLGVVFPTAEGDEPLIAFPLVLPMGWKNSPPVFSTATETIADLANQRLASVKDPRPHHLDEAAEQVVPENPLEASMPRLQPLPSVLRTSSFCLRPSRPRTVRWDPTLPHRSPLQLPVPKLRDPFLFVNRQ